jgi:toxin-antitoxin system PIN domain toxin
MRALLDVNVWIALLDSDHAFAERANAWFARERPTIATCPLTENGVARIMSSSGYSAKGRQSVAAISALMHEACAANDYEFWPDDVSLLDAGVFDVGRLHGSRQITDAYLLALAIRKGGRFVTFDEAIPLSAVRGASKRHLLVL